MRDYLLLVGLLLVQALFAADEVTGTVFAGSEPVIGAEVLWKNTVFGTVTDMDGRFALARVADSDTLVVHYLGYDTRELVVGNRTSLQVLLTESRTLLADVSVTARAASTVQSRVTAIQTQSITGAELCKAACCNLSESFETNASVDVAYSDAATGAKQIKMLGLSGMYVQMLNENTPGIRGLAANYGMDYIPGAWMESIQVSKGTASVVNGYEATTGQINVEFLKPAKADPIAINAMINSELHAELNATGGWELNDNVSTAVLAHYQNASMEHDTNGDGFMDMPKNNQANLLNRWDWKSGDYTGRLLVRGIYDDRIGGQTKRYIEANNVANPYSIGINTVRVDGFLKNGVVFNPELGTSIGIILSGAYHRQKSHYGATNYLGTQGNAYLNALFQTYFDEHNHHKLTAGISLNYDHYDELLTDDNRLDAAYHPVRDEVTPGIFAEYDFKLHEKLSLLVGARADYSNVYGFFATPRLNVRYSPWEWWNLRASVGLGYRSPNVVCDNAALFANSRQIVFVDDHFEQERALNAGISTTFYIPLGSKELQLNADYYYTHFFSCVIADYEQTGAVRLYNLEKGGRSYAGNLQVEASMEILRGWTMSLAYRWSDVRQTIDGVLREKPLTNRFKGLITTSYQTPLKKWQFDVTAQFNGGGRLPDSYAITQEQLDSHQVRVATNGDKQFNWYPQLMAQITKYFRTCSIYVGAENMTNHTQKSPVLDADAPFGTKFDASSVFAPINGWKIYAGFRWALDKKER